MKWQSPDKVPANEKEVLVCCLNPSDLSDGKPFYTTDWWNFTRGCFVGAHSDGFDILAWAEIEDPPQEFMEVKNTATNNARDEICPNCGSNEIQEYFAPSVFNCKECGICWGKLSPVA